MIARGNAATDEKASAAVGCTLSALLMLSEQDGELVKDWGEEGCSPELEKRNRLEVSTEAVINQYRVINQHEVAPEEKAVWQQKGATRGRSLVWTTWEISSPRIVETGSESS
ncbi:hypothetical protein AOLI_G00252340 [Acnodon oligacanthus]